MATRKQVQEALQRKKEGAQSRGASLDLENDVAEETMSAMVRLAKDPVEPLDIDQPTPEWRDDSRPMQGGGEDTDERVMMPHTEMCEDSKVTSVEEVTDMTLNASLRRRAMRLRAFWTK